MSKTQKTQKTQKTPPPHLYGPFSNGRALAIYPTGHVIAFDGGEVQDIRLTDEYRNDIDKLPCVPVGDVVVLASGAYMMWSDENGSLHMLTRTGQYLVCQHRLPTVEEVQEMIGKREAHLIENQRRTAEAERVEAIRRAAQAEHEAARWNMEAERLTEVAKQLQAEETIAKTGEGATDARRRALELAQSNQPH